MMEMTAIGEIAEKAARTKRGPKNVSRVLAEPSVDSEGHEALRVLIVIPAGAVARISGDAALDTLVELQQRLRKAGEDRLAIVEYATEEELADSGDPEP